MGVLVHGEIAPTEEVEVHRGMVMWQSPRQIMLLQHCIQMVLLVPGGILHMEVQELQHEMDMYKSLLQVTDLWRLKGIEV